VRAFSAPEKSRKAVLIVRSGRQNGGGAVQKHNGTSSASQFRNEEVPDGTFRGFRGTFFATNSSICWDFLQRTVQQGVGEAGA
jgi:hypothetical protein